MWADCMSDDVSRILRVLIKDTTSYLQEVYLLPTAQFTQCLIDILYSDDTVVDINCNYLRLAQHLPILSGK